MGLFSDFFKSKTDENLEQKISLNDNTSTYVNEFGETSKSVTEDTAMKIASLHQGVNIISDTIASMPIYLFKETDGFQEVFLEDSRSRLFSNMANEVLTSFNLKKNLIKDLILYGNSYAKIVRESEDRVKLYYLPPNIVTPRFDTSGYFFNVQSYSTDVMGEQVQAEVIDYYDMLTPVRNPKHNSVTGVGLLEYASNMLSMSMHETDYMINLFKNGLSAKAVLSSKTPFKKEIKEQLKSDLKQFYSGANNAGKMLVLEGDISVMPLSLTPTDIKLIENKNLTIVEIARFLNIPKHMLSLDRGQGTYSNITQERLQLLQNTLTPFCVILEEALNQKLLTEEEIEQGYYFQFHTAEMLKLTPEDNSKYMLELFREHIVTLEEVRASLNLGGDDETINELKQVQEWKYNNTKNTLLQNGDEVQSKEEGSKKETPKDSENPAPVEKEKGAEDKKKKVKEE